MSDEGATAGGITATVDDGQHGRFWIAFDTANLVWQGGHTAPTSGILKVTSGTFKTGPSGIILFDPGGALLGQVADFKRGTMRGDRGRGHLEDPPNNFSWTGV